jgi:hypothetical protein
VNTPAVPNNLTLFSISACADERDGRKPYRHSIVTQPDSIEPESAANNQAPENPFRRYRRQTFGILRRYLYCCTQLGRAPNVLGRENQNTGKSDQPSYTFEDEMIFALDVERALQRLRRHSLQALSMVILEEHPMDEAAVMLGWGARTIYRIFPEALDEFSEVLLRLRLLQPAHGHEITAETTRPSAILEKIQSPKFLVKGSNRIQ